MMRFLFCYMVAGILFSLQGYSHPQRDIPDSTYLLNYNPDDDTEERYVYGLHLDENPYFKEGKQVLIDWFQANVSYPDELLDHNLRMNCHLAVVADTLGRISLEKMVCSIPEHIITGETYPKLRDSIARRMDKEILKAMDSFPLCEPGKRRGKKVAVHFFLTFLFNLSVEQQKRVALEPLCISIPPLR